MKAGRELDALIAEKVFGEPNPPKKVSGASEWSAWRLTAEYVPRWTPKSFSIQIADAWLVVEKLEGFSLKKSFRNFREDEKGEFVDGEAYWVCKAWAETAEAPTAQLAICLAALEAVE